jgi:uroporphyrinogen decarboxylase
MDSRKRVNKALNHQEPDKVPVDLGGFVTTIEAEPYEDLKKYLGLKTETMIFLRAHVAPDEEVLEKFSIDTRYLWPSPLQKWADVNKQDTLIDGWGIKWHRPKGGHYYDPIDPPLSNYSYDDLKYYKYPPDLWNKEYEEELAKKAERLYKDTDYFLIADSLLTGIFEQAEHLRGFENFMIDLAINKDFANKLLDIILEQRKEFYDRFLDIVGPYVDMVMVADDLAGQDTLLISPQTYRELIKPRHKELNSLIKNKADVKIFYHCCGAVSELINDLIDEGVDILNPIQVSAKNMDSKILKKNFGEKIVFWGGGCETQQVLPFGTPEEVDCEVKKRISDLKPGGGFVFAQIHEIQPGIPPENILAMYKAVEKYRNYH